MIIEFGKYEEMIAFGITYIRKCIIIELLFWYIEIKWGYKDG